MAATLTPIQLKHYFTRIGSPPTTKWPPDLEDLTTLMRHHLIHVPYENLSIHYSDTHSISLSPPALFHKIVVRGHGGYCMELNTMFAALLNSLGFDVHLRAGRVWKVGNPASLEGKPDPWTGWSHMVLLVKIKDKTYLVDVGFGSNGPVRPLELLDEIVDGVVPEQHQLDVIQAPHAPDQKVWILRHRRDPSGEWTPLFTFDAETPFSMADYEIMSFHSHCHPTSPFVKSVLCGSVGFDGKIATTRKLLQNNVIKNRLNGENQVVKRLDSEEERLEAIEKLWKIIFTEKEKEGVYRWGVAITGPTPEKPVNIAGWS